LILLFVYQAGLFNVFASLFFGGSSAALRPGFPRYLPA